MPRRTILHARHLRTTPDPTGGTPTGGGGSAGPVIPPGAKTAPPADGDSFTDPDTGETFRFPSGKPTSSMTPEQQAEYWRHKARKHEARANATKDYDDVLRELDALKTQHQTAEEKALAEAREQARREGENIGADRYLPYAVRGEIRASNPAMTAEQVDALMTIIDPHKLVNDKGDVDTAKVAAAIAPLMAGQPATQLQLHQGGRRAAATSARDRGLAEAERRGYITKQA